MRLNIWRLAVFLILLVALIQGVHGIQVTGSGGSNGDIGSVLMNLDTLKFTSVSSQMAINGATVTPSTSIKGPIAKFEETHTVTDASGKSASVYIQVINAPKGMKYTTQVQPGEGNVDTQPQVSAEQWLTVPKADSIKCTATSSFGSLFAYVGLDETKGTLKGDYVKVTGYYGKSLTTSTSAHASQTATSGEANSIKIYGTAQDGIETYGINTQLLGISGKKATFAGLSEMSEVGTTTQVAQNEHILGTFTSTATYTPTVGVAEIKTRTSDYGTEYDLDMKAAKGSLPTGTVGYYVKSRTAAPKIQDAIDTAQSGDTINVAAGNYQEKVNINKELTVIGKGNPKATSFSLNALLGTGSGGISAPIIYVNPLASIQNGVTLASSKGTVNIAAGTYIENVQIDKSLNVKGDGSTETIVDGNKAGPVFTLGKNAAITLSGLKIQNGHSDRGGGILNNGKLTIRDCTISGNSVGSDSATGYGGGIANMGTATVTNCVIQGNSFTGFGKYICFGGGIYNWGTLTVTDSIISGNSVESSTTPSIGGGIANMGTATIASCTISENSANKGAGFANSGGKATVTGSIISDNIGKSYVNNDMNFASLGGGIYNGGYYTDPNGKNVYHAPALTVKDCTISGNDANLGGGIANQGPMTATKNAQKLTISGTSRIIDNTANRGGGIFSHNSPVTFEGTKVSIKSNQAGWPDSLLPGTPWYQGWGVYMESDVPITKKGFDPTKQVTDNIKI